MLSSVGFLIVVVLSKAEVNESDRSILALTFKENVFWFEVSVTNTSVLQVFDGREDLLDDLGSIGFRELASCYDVFKEFTPSTKLSDQVAVIVIHIHLVEVDDVGMINLT